MHEPNRHLGALDGSRDVPSGIPYGTLLHEICLSVITLVDSDLKCARHKPQALVCSSLELVHHHISLAWNAIERFGIEELLILQLLLMLALCEF